MDEVIFSPYFPVYWYGICILSLCYYWFCLFHVSCGVFISIVCLGCSLFPQHCLALNSWLSWLSFSVVWHCVFSAADHRECEEVQELPGDSNEAGLQWQPLLRHGNERAQPRQEPAGTWAYFIQFLSHLYSCRFASLLLNYYRINQLTKLITFKDVVSLFLIR